MDQDKNITNPFAQPVKSAYTPSAFLKTLRSYKGDVEEQMHNKKESVASIVIAQKKADIKAEERIGNTPIVQKKPKLFELPKKPMGESFISHIKITLTPIFIVILLILGAGLLTGAYYVIKKPAPVVTVASTSIIPYTSEKSITLTSDIHTDITQTFTNLLQTTHTQIGSVTALHFLQNNIELSINEFFQAIAPTAPDALVRSFHGSYMSGIYSSIDNETFIILSTEDYDQTFAGMLAWEPYIQSDLATLFPAVTNVQNIWTDDTFNNQNVRIIRDASGAVVLVYGFLDKNTLVITGDETVFQQIASQYINNKLVR